MSVSRWKHFGRKVRPGRTDLLRDLPKFNNAILIAGCQRSGGTMLAKAINQHSDVATFGWSKDTELDAAQLLAGDPSPTFRADDSLRYCFQTTYLNEQAGEYLDHAQSIYLVWLIRNPHSVIYSMVHNWKRFALNEVFLGCGTHLLNPKEARRLSRFGVLSVPPVKRACYAYLGKLEQASMLIKAMPEDRFATCEYEELVKNKPVMLDKLFRFANLSSETSSAGEEISTRSLNKAKKLKSGSRVIVDKLCAEAYEKFCREHITITAS